MYYITVCYVVVISDDKVSERVTNSLVREVREWMLEDFWLVLSWFPD